MKRLKPILFILMLISPIVISAQLDPVSLALRAYQDQQLLKAKEFIDVAFQDNNYQNQSKTWYFGGYIYKDLYKGSKKTPAGHEYRNISINAFLKTLEYDKTLEFKEDCITSLKFLAASLYNDAAVALDTNNFDVAQKYYDQYKQVLLALNPSQSFKQNDIEFMVYKASKYSLLFDEAPAGANTDELASKIIESYEKVLLIDSNNINANYNLAIHYYNQGVNIIDNMDYSLDFEQLFQIQDHVMQLFQKALPYMRKAYKLDPTRKATLQGLSGIYFGLNDIEKSEFYQKELEKLEGSGN